MRGYWAVLVLVVAGLLAAIPVLLVRPEVVFGPPLLLILAEDAISATPASTTVGANFGPACSRYAWNTEKQFLAVDADESFAGVDGLILQHYGLRSTNFANASGDLIAPRFLRAGSSWTVISPVDGRTLAAFTRSGDSVTVNGTTYAPGAAWSLRFEYDTATPGGTVHVVESIAFRNEGTLRPHVVPAHCR